MKTDSEILAELNDIFKEVLDLDDLVLTNETKADDVEDWDSLAHMQLTLAIGKHYGIKFTTAEIISWKNVGCIVATIKKHLS